MKFQKKRQYRKVLPPVQNVRDLIFSGQVQIKGKETEDFLKAIAYEQEYIKDGIVFVRRADGKVEVRETLYERMQRLCEEMKGENRDAEYEYS